MNVSFSRALPTNFEPHFVNGISGNDFPGAFPKPPGKYLSPPNLIIIWALLNLLKGCLHYKFAKVSAKDNLSLILFFAGFALINKQLRKQFAYKLKFWNFFFITK